MLFSLRSRVRRPAALLALTAACLAPAHALGAQGPARTSGASDGIPTIASVLGFEPGADRHLPSWTQIVTYFTALDAASPRVSVRTLGKTTLGRPFIVAFIADSATLANLEHYRQIQRKLMDPRRQAPGERERLLDEGKNVILVTSSIHSTEVGGFTTPLLLADRLARAADDEAREILANTIIMLVPSQNPDGVDIVGDHYRATLGTPAEGSGPPDLYHKYVGHDDNRDWYAFTQVETRYTVDSLYTPWDPQIVNDIHQQGGNAGRLFIPPYMDPVEPNIDPILTAATNGLGMAMVWRMTNEGFTGIASNASYDQWSPARQYPFYHRGARLLTETASARLATPVEVPFERLGTGRGYDAKVSSWNFPAPWPGGRWGYGDIVRYQTAASWALFLEAAQNRRAWLEGYAAQGERALAEKPAWGSEPWPSAIVIPKAQADTQAVQRLLWTLQHGQVEIRETTAPVTVDGRTLPAGSYAVLTRQPFGSYAKALLERQHYPNLFEYPGGPPKRPYDVTAHTLPLLFGVEVAHVMGAAPATGEPIAAVAEPTYTAPLTGARTRRIALMRLAANESMDHGWTHFIFDSYRVPYTIITDEDVAKGDLRARFDAIVISDGSLARGGRGGRGGRGRGGADPAAVLAALDSFVTAGGTVLAFNEASTALAEGLHLPVRDVLDGVANTEFYAPGSILSVEIARDHPIARGFTAPVPAVWFESGPAFEITDPSQATAVARYPATGDPLLSGWLLGGEKLHGAAALVDVRRGQGHVVLYGFRPQYRGQSVATYPLIWGAIMQ
ncbi:MAG TPA: M14 family zinc carboxypeptidase [Gemmatimonadaceae bacterium]|nr:M14 family zinc carboxypeptidase [Gemmatimonadaceae bacterium]